MSDGKKSSADHLRAHQFKPGQTGNAGGRPKGYERRLREVVDAMKADDPVPDPSPDAPKDAEGNPAKIPAFEAIVKQAVIDAVKGDRYARDFIADRLMGKPRQTVDVSTSDRPPAEIDWDSMPLDERRELLERFKKLGLVADGAPTEH